jgi:hypothetical protein
MGRLQTISAPLREALAIGKACELFGFSVDAVKLSYDDGNREVVVEVHWLGRVARLSAGKLMIAPGSPAFFGAQWTAAQADWIAASEAERVALWKESEVQKDPWQISKALRAAGIQAPKLVGTPPEPPRAA